jgi:hypothetical protein
MVKIRISHPDGYTAVKLTDETAEGDDVKTIDYTPIASGTDWVLIKDGETYSTSSPHEHNEGEGFLSDGWYICGHINAPDVAQAIQQFQRLIAACKKVIPLE